MVKKVAIVALLLAARLQAQTVLSDSSYTAGRFAGAAAAATTKTPSLFGFGALTGLVFGFTAPVTFSGESGMGFKALTGLSGAAMFATLRSASKAGNQLPSMLERELSRSPEAYREGFRAGFEDRLKSRAQNQAVGGVIMGTLVGVGSLIYFVTHIE